MSYLVFARKFRPQTFADVKGQAPVVRTLQNAITSGRIGHAFLFAGARGVGKTTIARILAKALNCEKGPSPEPCLSCTACVEVAAGRDLDVLEIDGASNRGIDEVKEIRESVRYSPARNRFKIFIIDEVHMLTPQAFNALLKTLEEPPSHVKFIFATTELHAIPATVLSRCQHYEFRRIPFREIMAQLSHIAKEEGLSVDDDALVLLARAADGSLRDGLSAFDQVVSFAGTSIAASDVAAVLGLIDRELVHATTERILAGDAEGVIACVERLLDAGFDLRTFAAELTEHFRNLLVVKAVRQPDALLALSDSERARLARLAEGVSQDEALRLLNAIGSAEQDLKQSNRPRFTLERVLLSMAAMGRLRPLDEILAALGEGASGDTPLPQRRPLGSEAATTPPASAPAPSSSVPPRPTADVAARVPAPPPTPRSAPAPAEAAPQPAAAAPAAAAEPKQTAPAVKRGRGTKRAKAAATAAPPAAAATGTAPPAAAATGTAPPAVAPQVAEPVQAAAEAAAAASLQPPAESAGAAGSSLRSALAAALLLRKQSTASLLEQAARVELKDGVLEIAFAPDQRFFMTSLAEPHNQRLVEAAALEATGTKKVRFRELAETELGELPPDPRAALERRVAADPAVKDFMDVFQARILDVEES